jgi:hypothetical protein
MTTSLADVFCSSASCTLTIADRCDSFLPHCSAIMNIAMMCFDNDTVDLVGNVMNDFCFRFFGKSRYNH